MWLRSEGLAFSVGKAGPIDKGSGFVNVADMEQDISFTDPRMAENRFMRLGAFALGP